MRIEIVKRAAFRVCGYAVTTSLTQYGHAPAQKELFENYFRDERPANIAAVADNPAELYGLAWLVTRPGDRIQYLLGSAVTGNPPLPAGAIIKEVAPATYAMTRLDPEMSLQQGWMEFFYIAGGQIGYSPDYHHDVWFERLPTGVHGPTELWMAVTNSVPSWADQQSLPEYFRF
ncbi:MAG: GyrI-like domain-containing protein [Propionibacteriaceae bacterium]|nr:GyrI-like domain-containing protein [Propionibacteriaceae bacterium]